MSNKDIAVAVNTFMLNSAPTLVEASPMAYEMLKSLARQLMFNVRTTSDHAAYVIGKKYSHLYAPSVVSEIIKEAHDDEMSERIDASRRRREMKMNSIMQPALLAG